MATCSSVLPGNLLDVLRNGVLSEEQARMIYEQGPEAVVFALLELTKRLAEQRAAGAAQSHETPSTPSGMKPPYQKPPGKRRKRRPGAKPGHRGSRRKPPEHIDHHKEHRADRCPRLRWSSATLRGNPYPLYRRHSAHSAGSDRAYDPPRLVPQVPETGRADGSRRPAWLDAGQPCAGAVGLAALRPGQYALADRGGLQLPLADEDHFRRAGADVVSLAGDPLRLVRADSATSLALGGAASRTKAVGGSMAKRTGCGALRRGT